MSLFRIFKIHREEWPLAIYALLYVTALNALAIWWRWDYLYRNHRSYYQMFNRQFEFSGFDAHIYKLLSCGHFDADITRHPLLNLLYYPFYLLNDWIIDKTGMNCAIFFVAAVMIFCGFYALTFLYRILHEIVGTDRRDALLLTVLFSAFGYIMLSIMGPDHFCLSMFCLLLSLYVFGRALVHKRYLKLWKAGLLFFLTAGITLTNGVKVLLAEWFVYGKKVWRWKFILMMGILPVSVLAGAFLMEHECFVRPQRYRAFQAELIRAKLDTEHPERVAQTIKQWSEGDTIDVVHRNVKWLDDSLSRRESIVHNVLGESLIFHEDYFLKDIFSGRPFIVKYKFPANYVIEAVLVVLFLCGVWFGRRSKFLWLCMSWLAFDVFLHIILGFALNEVYIMTAHWAFLLPIVMAHLLRQQTVATKVFRYMIAAITIYLLIWNVALLL